MNNPIEIDDVLFQFEKAFNLLTCDLPEGVAHYDPEDLRKARITQLRWTHLNLNMMHHYAKNSLKMIEMHQENTP